jgi:Tfp pilus assembly protein PilF
MKTTRHGRTPAGVPLLVALVFLGMGFTPLAEDIVPRGTAAYQAAEAALAKGDIGQARRELRRSLRDEPLHAESHYLLALLLAREEELDEAAVGFQQTLTLAPNHAGARYNMGTALLRRGEPVAAARELEDALALRPDHLPSYNNLAKAYFLSGLPDLAAATYQEVLRRDPANPTARKSLAVLTQAADSESSRRPGQVGGLSRDASNRRSITATNSRAFLAAAGQKPGAGAGPAAPAQPAEENGAHPESSNPPDEEVRALRELLHELPQVIVERRLAGVVVTGWTSSPAQRKLLERILAGRANVLDLTTEDVGSPHRLIEVDATIFKVIGLESDSVGHNFLRRISVNASIADGAMASFNWLYSAALSYEVNIANVSEQRIALLARPHLTALSGTPATFVAGGELVYQVAGNISGDIKPYPFGTTLDVTPTLLRTTGEDGSPRVRLVAKAGRRTLLPLSDVDGADDSATVFENISVTSEAVLGINQTLILTGLNQRESRTRRSGVPGLRSIPIIKYLFSEKVTTTSDLAIIILLTPRDPAFWDEQNRKATAEFVEKRRAFVQASQGTEEDLRRFRERYPDWDQFAPNRFASHFFLIENSEAYRKVSGIDLATEDLDLELLGPKPQKKKRSTASGRAR